MTSTGGPFSWERFQPRIVAGLVHVGIGLCILAPLTYLIVFHWYPGALFSSDGGLRGMHLLIGVDIVLGPGLTFLAYDIAKSRGKIKFDLCVIGVLQAGALAWGVHAIHSQRPVALVFDQGRFVPLLEDMVKQQGSSIEILRKFHAQHPPLIFSLPPKDKQDLAQAFLLTLNEGLDLFAQIPRMRPLADHLPEVKSQRLSLDKHSQGQALKLKLEELAKTKSSPVGQLSVYRFAGRYQDAYLVLDDDGDLLGYLDLPDS